MTKPRFPPIQHVYRGFIINWTSSVLASIMWTSGRSRGRAAPRPNAESPGMALEGPDSDALKGVFRDNDGQGVHFSGPGLRAHASRWVEKVGSWLERQVAGRAR